MVGSLECYIKMRRLTDPVNLHINYTEIAEKQQLCYKFYSFFIQIEPALATNQSQPVCPDISCNII